MHPLRRGIYRLHGEFSQRIDAMRPLDEQDPVLVYSMRKVGSTSITATLRNQRVVVHKQHSINPIENSNLDRLLTATGQSRQHWLVDGRRFARRLSLWRRRREGGRLRVFTFVKDPLAIAVSDVFMQLFELMPAEAIRRGLHDEAELLRFLHEVLEADSASGDFLLDFLSTLCRWPRRWFDDEFAVVLGVNVLQAENTGEGYSTLRGFDSDIVVLRSDRLDAIGPAAIAQLLAQRPTALVRTNVAATTSYAGLYRRTLDRLRLPPPLVAAYLDASWLGRFYSDDELEGLHRRWTRGPSVRA